MWGVLVLVILLVMLFSYLDDNPSAAILLWVFMGLMALVIWVIRDNRNKTRIESMLRMAYEVEQLVSNFEPIDSTAIMRNGELALYERDEVLLREPTKTGAKIDSGFGGVTLGITNNIGIALGKGSGQITENPIEMQTIDTGSVVFTTQRIIFTGSMQTRTWELDDLVKLEPGVNGFEVSIASSESNVVSILAGDSKYGITPGVAAQIAHTLKVEGEEAARRVGLELVENVKAAAKKK